MKLITNTKRVGMAALRPLTLFAFLSAAFVTATAGEPAAKPESIEENIEEVTFSEELIPENTITYVHLPAPHVKTEVPPAWSIDEEPLVNPEAWVDTMLIHPRRNAHPFRRLTEEDYRAVAEELGIEVAAIKAVVDIEAGRSHEGFWKEGYPLINFDLSMYRQIAPRHGVNLKNAQKKAPEVFRRPDIKRYGSYQGAQYARLNAAEKISPSAAQESTFWGMFQIGGFNWKKCGTASVEEFVELMSRSERDQLELFARFIKQNGMVESIRNKQWLAFALKYNGPRAKARGYHTRLAAAYARHSR